MEAKEVKEFFERVASEWDAMRLAYFDERVIEKMAPRQNEQPPDDEQPHHHSSR